MARMALSIILSFGIASVVAAQDAVPETPPELRGFRLDTPRPAPQRQPEVQPPPVVPTVEPATQPTTARAERRPPAQVRPSPQPATNSTTERTRTDEDVQPAPEVIAEPPPSAAMPPAENIAPVVKEVPAPSEPSATPWWQIAAALVAALALLGGWLLWRKRREDSVSDARPQRPLAQAPTPAPAVIPEIITPAEPIAKRPRITLEFVPDKATLGFSALTLKGQLRLVNQGDAPASDMQLRATMISANQRQKETIAAFHGGSIPIEPNALGNAKEGERIALEIEMAVQVAEIDSYDVGDKQIFVPVMLANVAYSWDGGSDNITIACMIGRETEPPGSKMGPLRLDLGPRSFAPLGQRPLTT
jgi:hypothetical protein